MQMVQFHYRNVGAAFYLNLSEFNSLTVLLEWNKKSNNRQHEQKICYIFDTSYSFYIFLLCLETTPKTNWVFALAWIGLLPTQPAIRPVSATVSQQEAGGKASSADAVLLAGRHPPPSNK